MATKKRKMIPRISKSRKFRSVRHLAEVLFQKKPSITREEFESKVLSEYPGSRVSKGHFSWYRHKILVKQETKDR